MNSSCFRSGRWSLLWPKVMAKVGRPSNRPLHGGIQVGAEEGDRGRVVVQFVQAEAELLDHVRGHGQHQRRHVGGEQLVQGPPHAVVVRAGRPRFRSSPADRERSGRPTRPPRRSARARGADSAATPAGPWSAESFVRPSSFGKASRRNSSRRIRPSSRFTRGNGPTVAERNTHPRARATGGDSGGADDGFPRVDRERLATWLWDSFSSEASAARRSAFPGRVARPTDRNNERLVTRRKCPPRRKIKRRRACVR